MSKFKIIVGESSTIVREGLKNYGTFAPINDGCSRLPTTGIYANIVEGERDNTTGEIVYLFIGLLSDTFRIIQDIKDSEDFQVEHHFEVIDYDGNVDKEFNGTLFDAILFLKNEGLKYIRR